MLNKVMLIGRLGQEPEVNDNQTCVKFSLATNKKVNGEQVSQWHNCIAFGKTIEIIQQYYSKGDLIYVEGELEYSEYEKEGVKRYATKILVRTTYNMTPKSDKTSTAATAANLGFNQSDKTMQKQPTAPQQHDDLPF